MKDTCLHILSKKKKKTTTTNNNRISCNGKCFECKSKYRCGHRILITDIRKTCLKNQN